MDPRAGEPLLFGTDSAPLFGALHTPVAMPVTHAALLLPAGGHEYFSSHRSVRQLALRLAERGCMALRIDLRGCGDSAGEKDSGCLEQWREDAEQALQLLVARAPGARLGVVGVRLGASVALQLAAQRASAGHVLASLALWDPVLNGADYLRAALEMQHSHHGQRQPLDDGGPFEVMGHALSRTLVAQLREFSVARVTAPPAREVLLIDTLTAFAADIVERWRGVDTTVEYRAPEAPSLWSGDGQVALIPTAVVQHIADWLVPA